MAGEKFVELGRELGELVASKQVQYGDSAGKSGRMLAQLYPDGVKPWQMRDALLVTRVLDKLSRVAQRGLDGQDLGGESPWRDIAGYGLLGSQADAEVKAELAQVVPPPLPTPQFSTVIAPPREDALALDLSSPLNLSPTWTDVLHRPYPVANQDPPIHPTVKRCPKCETVKPLDEFTARFDSADKRGKYCLVCHRAMQGKGKGKVPGAKPGRRGKPIPPMFRCKCGYLATERQRASHLLQAHRADESMSAYWFSLAEDPEEVAS
jgi:hypothetical protein